MLTLNQSSGTWMELCFFRISATALNLPGTKLSQNQDLASSSQAFQKSHVLSLNMEWLALQSVRFSHSVMSGSVTPWTAARQARSVLWCHTNESAECPDCSSSTYVCHKPLYSLCTQRSTQHSGQVETSGQSTFIFKHGSMFPRGESLIYLFQITLGEYLFPVFMKVLSKDRLVGWWLG